MSVAPDGTFISRSPWAAGRHKSTTPPIQCLVHLANSNIYLLFRLLHLHRTFGNLTIRALLQYKPLEHTLFYLVNLANMFGPPPISPYGLPTTTRANRQMLAYLETTLPASRDQSPTPNSALSSDPSYSEKSAHYSDKTSPHPLINTRHRNRDSLIFINATVPLSPTSSSSSHTRENPYAGLAPKKRNAFGRLFCCFGRQERARRRVVRDTEFEKIGEVGHWTEY